MKRINFTAKEILQSLLDKSKTQTIRKAWNLFPQVDDSKPHGEKVSYTQMEKPAKYSVGEEVELLWDNNTHALYCFQCGKNKYSGECNHLDFDKSFSGELGRVRITEVFKIEIGKEETSKGTSFTIKKMYCRPDLVKECEEAEQYVDKRLYEMGIKNTDFEEIIKQDGFNSAEEMFKYLDDNYDLITHKEFWVYRWEWI